MAKIVLFDLRCLVTPENVVCLVCVVFMWLLATNVDCSTWDHYNIKRPTDQRGFYWNSSTVFFSSEECKGQ